MKSPTLLVVCTADKITSLAIAPWNAALTLTLRTIAVPILCGNTIVFKCSELSPRSQAIVADLFEEVSRRYCLIKWTIMDLLLGWPGGSTPRCPQHHLDFARNGAGANGRDHCPSDGSQSRRTSASVLILSHLTREDCQFTGSERVGRILAMEAAKFLKPCVLELGGKAPVVVRLF